MKVALIFPGCHRRGGVERVMLECANYLASRGHDVHLYVSDWDEASLRADIVIHPIRIRAKGALSRIIMFGSQAQREIRKAQPAIEVLGTHGCVCPGGGVAWAHSVHRAWIEHSRTARKPFSLGRLKQNLNPIHPILLKLEAEYFRKGNYRKVVAMTEQVKDDLKRFYNVSEHDIVVIPNGFAPSEFNVQRRTAERTMMRERLGYKDADRVVIFVANELERKGFAPLLRAIASLKDERIHLLAVGRLSADAYRSEINQLGMFDRVIFTGPSNDVASYYAAADVFALPTQYEAWGLVIVEAMACGLPALTSRLAGAAITIIEGQNGQLLEQPHNVKEVAQKLSSLLDGNHLSAEGIADSVAPYAWDQVLLRYEETLVACAT